ncbi:MAG: RQC domain-containing protein, partial [Blastocatellia bacterium]
LKRAASSSTGKDLSPADIARDLGVKREGSVRSALNVLEKAQLVRWGDPPSSSSIVSLAVPPEVALDRLPDSTREGLLLRHLIFECEIAGREAEVGEESLATRLGVSPPSVRDSISRLAGLGVIHSRRSELQATPRLLDLGESDKLKAERLSAEIAELSERLSAEHLKLRQMVEYCYHRRCLRLFILSYFGDSGKVSPCGECSNCKPPEETHSFVPVSKRNRSMRDREESTGTLVVNAPAGLRMASNQRRTASKARSAGPSGHFDDLASTEAWRVTAGGSSAGPHEYANRARLSLGARPLTDRESQIARQVLECVSRFNGRFGKGTIAAVLAGSDSLEIRTHRLNNSPGFGTLTGLSVPEINSFIRSLIEANCIAVCSGGYPTIGLTALGREVIRGRVVELHI